ncbi:MAG: sodium ion-translocating decarboxylase subunit beta [Ruminococcaceae bacterium]|nr:sodium ion-translocating decarboxylase subunit beta [Oscillospiraceae bacterium]
MREIFESMLETLKSFLADTGIFKLLSHESEDINSLADFSYDPAWWQTAVMFVIAFVLIYLAIGRKFEPLLLLPIAVGMLLTNLPGSGMFNLDFFIPNQAAVIELENAFADGIISVVEFEKLKELGLPVVEAFGKEAIAGDMTFTENAYELLMESLTSVNYGDVLHHGGLLDLLYLGVKLGIYPCLIFIGIGAMTDFSPLISNPKSLLIGAGAQFGVFVAFAGALFLGFDPEVAASIGIIGGADGPTAILVTKTLAPSFLGAIAIAAYSYMALIPMIQPPFMKLLTTKKERQIRMTTLRQVSKTEKILFPIVVTFVVGLIIPDALPLIGCLMFGNLLNVCGLTDRLSKTAQNELMNIVTIFLGITVGATASATNFLRLETLKIIALGLVAFCISTCGGLITAKIMNWLSGGKINPLIGSAGVSAVPMAARVSQKVGQQEDPSNFLLMHAMGPNVAGVIGSAVAAGVFLSMFAK